MKQGTQGEGIFVRLGLFGERKVGVGGKCCVSARASI